MVEFAFLRDLWMSVFRLVDVVKNNRSNLQGMVKENIGRSDKNRLEGKGLIKIWLEIGLEVNFLKPSNTCQHVKLNMTTMNMMMNRHCVSVINDCKGGWYLWQNKPYWMWKEKMITEDRCKSHTIIISLFSLCYCQKHSTTCKLDVKLNIKRSYLLVTL